MPNGETLLIDAGPERDTTADYISSLGYDKITYIVATHPDSDHITGMPDVLKTFEVDKFFMPQKEHTTKIYNEMISAISSNGCKLEYATNSKTILSLDDLNISFASPINIYPDNNASSATVRLSYDEGSFLFMGDADYSTESDILKSGFDVDTDVLKVGHHGSKTSTSQSFLNAVSPEIAVISVGDDNKYGHPTQEVLTLLSHCGANIYRTDESGTIIIECDGTDYTINKPKSTIHNTSTTQPQSISTTVYKTKTGSSYHRDNCSALKSRIEISLSQAKAEGLKPCLRCNPPQ